MKKRAMPAGPQRPHRSRGNIGRGKYLQDSWDPLVLKEGSSESLTKVYVRSKKNQERWLRCRDTTFDGLRQKVIVFCSQRVKPGGFGFSSGRGGGKKEGTAFTLWGVLNTRKVKGRLKVHEFKKRDGAQDSGAASRFYYGI